MSRRAGTAEHVERIVRGWRRVDRQVEARETARQHAATITLHASPDVELTTADIFAYRRRRSERSQVDDRDVEPPGRQLRSRR